jgi:hypothetical protein
MPYHRRTLLIAVSLASALLFSSRAGADTWIGESLELQVADADLVVRGTLEAFAQIRGSSEQKGTFHIIETLKGKADRSIECIIPYGDEKYLGAWQKSKTELLVCLAKSERYRAPGNRDPMTAEWSVRHVRFGNCGIIPLNGDPFGRVPTADFQFLAKPDEILKAAREAIHADAVTKVPREAGGAASVELEVPFGSLLDESLHSMSSNGLITVLNETLAAKASRWIKADGEMEKLNGVSVLSHFKSDENIAALKTLLTDSSAQRRLEGRDIITTYSVRAAALAALKSWGVEATAVVSERAPQKDR